MIEIATTHAVATVMVEGYAKRRAADRRRHTPVIPSGGPNVSEWERLAAFAESRGRVQRGGERLVN